MTHKIYHNTTCEHCKHDLRQPGSVSTHVSVAGNESDFASQVKPDGELADSADGAISAGFHAGSYCVQCGELLEELEPIRIDNGH